MEAVAQDMDSSRAQLALAWVLSRRQIASAIMGATTLQQLEENLAAAELELPPEVVESLDEIFS
jgi:aryl-alcohol dehydrogenase-like predicted oxidoreductase